MLKAGNFAQVADAIETHWLDAIAPMRAAIRVEGEV
jgi:hypothetical protein